MKENIRKLKLELKELASQIKTKKKQRSKENGGFVSGLLELRVAYRHKHVAYSLARGRNLEQVDSGEGLSMKRVEWLLDAMKNNDKTRLYVVVNSSLSPAQQAVQGGHAVAAFLKKYPYTQWSNGYLIYKKDDYVWNGNLRAASYCLKDEVNQYAEFIEPDMDNKVTAYAAFGPDVEFVLSRCKLV